MTSRNLYLRLFFAHNGPGPYSCHFCRSDVSLEKVHVHHLDHNHSNDDPKNLVASHSGCHSRHHGKGKIFSLETRTKMSTAAMGHQNSKGHQNHKGHLHSPEVRAKIGDSQKGKIIPLEARANMSTVQMGHAVAQETRNKISESLRNNQNAKGAVRSQETRDRISTARKLRG
jgi:hypothetical protein